MFNFPETINVNLNINLKGYSMSQLTDAMTAVVAAIKAGQSTVDQAHLAAIDSTLAALGAGEATDAANIADIQAGLKVLSDGLAPAAASAPSPAPEAVPTPGATGATTTATAS